MQASSVLPISKGGVFVAMLLPVLLAQLALCPTPCRAASLADLQTTFNAKINTTSNSGVSTTGTTGRIGDNENRNTNNIGDVGVISNTESSSINVHSNRNNDLNTGNLYANTNHGGNSGSHSRINDSGAITSAKSALASPVPNSKDYGDQKSMITSDGEDSSSFNNDDSAFMSSESIDTKYSLRGIGNDKQRFHISTDVDPAPLDSNVDHSSGSNDNQQEMSDSESPASGIDGDNLMEGSDSSLSSTVNIDKSIGGLPTSAVVMRKSSSTNTLSSWDKSDASNSNRVVRGIMENFAGDFDSPPEALFSDDFFNREPYYYDVYYDNFEPTNLQDDNVKSAGAETDLTEIVIPDAILSQPKKSLFDDFTDFPALHTTSDLVEPKENNKLTQENSLDPSDYEVGSEYNAEMTSIQDTLDLQLLGADLQAELGFVLEQLTNGSQRNRRHHHSPGTHRGSRSRNNSGVAVGIRGSTCPPPVHSLPPGLCGVPPCTSHMMCYPSRMCCFNGCTYTCTHPIHPPPVIDWLEDSASHLPVLDPSNPSLPLRFEVSPLFYGTGGGEIIRLPGGCTLSSTKYTELKQFMTADSIQDCLCSGGEVICVVKSSPPEP